MRCISEKSGVALNKQSSDQGVDLGCWQAVRDFEGGWAGKVIIQCRDPKELHSIREVVHCKGIAVEGHTTSLLLTSGYLDIGNTL